MDYSCEVRRRFSGPARAGELLPGAARVVEGAAEDRSLAVWVRFQLRIEAQSIIEARFRAYGCPHTLAAADLIAGELEGKSVAALQSIDLEAVARQLDLPREKHGKLLRIEDALTACYEQASHRERG